MSRKENLTTAVSVAIASLLAVGCMIQEPKITDGKTTQLIQTATKVVFSSYPSVGSAASVWSTQPVVELYDKDGSLVTTGPDAWAPITISLYSGTGILSGQLTMYAVQGRAQFIGLKIDLSGEKYLKVVKSDLSTYGGSEELSAIGSAFTISSAAASKLKLEGSSLIQPGTCNPYILSAQDGGGNIVTLSTVQSIGLTISGNATVYSDANCTTSIVSTTIGSNVSENTVYARTYGHESIKLFAAPYSIALSSAEIEIKSNVLVLSDFSINSDYTVKCFVYTNGSGYCTDSGFVNFNKKISKISVGSFFKCALLEDGTVWCWGDGSSGQLGNGASVTSSTPVQVSNLGGTVSDLISGYYYTCALVTISNIGQVKCWGANNSRQLGDTTTTTRNSATSVSLGLSGALSVVAISKSSGQIERNFAVFNDGTAKSWGGGSATTYNPASVSGLTTAVNLTAYSATGMNHYCALNIDKTVNCWGTHNSNGQLGSGDFNVYSSPNPVAGLTDIKTIANSYLNSCALKSDGTLYCWGYFTNSMSMLNGLGNYVGNEKTINVNTAKFMDWLPKFKLIKPYYYYNSYYGKTNNYFCGITLNDNNFLCIKWHTGANLPEVVYDTKSKPHQYLTLESSATKIHSGSCQKLSSKLYKNTNSHNVNYNILISFSIANNFGSIYSDSTCTQTITQVILPSGQSSVDVYLKTTNNTTDPKFSYIGLSTDDPSTGTMGTSIETIGQPYDLGNVYEVNAVNGACSGYSVHLVDTMGNYTKAGITDITASLVSSDGTLVKVYSDSNCTIETGSVNISAGASGGIFYLKLFSSCNGTQITVSTPSLSSSSPKSIGYYEGCGCD